MSKQVPPGVRVLSGQEFALLTARPELRIMGICLAIAITGVAQGLSNGWDIGSWMLVAGSAGAVSGLFFFGRTMLLRERSITSAASTHGLLLPYLFGCYLTFFRGFWNGRVLLETFSVGRFLALAVFIYLGYRLVYWTWQFSEIGSALHDGRLVIASAPTEPLGARD